MADTYCTAQEPLALGCFEAFLTPRRFGCEEPEWPRPKAKKREGSAGFSAGLCLGSSFKVRYARTAAGVVGKEFEVERRGLLHEWEPPRRSNP